MTHADPLSLIQSVDTLDALEQARVTLLGKKGQITEQLKALGQASVEERKEKGRVLNELRDRLTGAIEERKRLLEASEEAQRLAHERVDVTLPIREESKGSLHPITQVMDEVVAIFAEMGFGVRTGPLVEDDEHNFGALNIPPSHPARQMHDTFYVSQRAWGNESPMIASEETIKYVLRTHTSPVQIRTMRSEKPPIRIIAPGSTFRSDSDMTHTPMFHQVEGLVIEKNIHMGHLKGCVAQFLRQFFGINDLPVRFRPSFFPFTEPSAEVDIGCERSRAALRVGQGTDWLEIMGCGMVHPTVLQNCGLDPSEWQGFAFGMGIERLAMLKYNIPDLRTFFDSDSRWLDYYGFSPLKGARP
ncbi:MAG: phenylalanine--tRNA ligase subunit alpha [Rickettsiales bacterium]|nr:phenylalanine--tRNA ligase subunit alpha [Rickettsiales bacterium]